MNRLLAWLAASTASLVTFTAFGIDESPLLGVLSDSAGADKVAASVREALPGKWRAVSKADFDAALKAARKEKPTFNVPLAAAFKNDKQREMALSKLRAALSGTSAKAALFVTTSKPGKKGSLHLYLVNSLNDIAMVEEEIVLDGQTTPTELVTASIKPTLEKWAPAQVVEKPKIEEKAETKVVDAPKKVDTSPHKGEIEHAMAIVGVGLEIGGRSLGYSNPTTTNLRPYNLFGGAAPAIDAEVYPGARTSVPFLRDLGIAGGFRIALGLQSRTPEGVAVGTAWNRFDAGLRYRLRFGEGRKPQVGIRFGIARENFTFSATATDYPAATYFYLRPAADVWVPIGIVALFGEFAVLPTLSSGETARRFSGTSVLGFEGKGGVALTPNDWLLVRASFSYEYFGYSMTPNAGDAFAATGANDAFMRIHVGAGAFF